LSDTVKDGAKMHRKSSLHNRLTWYYLSLETGSENFPGVYLHLQEGTTLQLSILVRILFSFTLPAFADNSFLIL